MGVEATIQRALVRWIRENYPHVKIIAAQNENSRHHIEQGMDIGLPDLMLLWRENDVLQMFFLELKTKKGRLSASQKDWAADYALRFAASNTQYAVAYGFAAAREAVQKGISSSRLNDSLASGSSHE
jgi:hypothetical protein